MIIRSLAWLLARIAYPFVYGYRWLRRKTATTYYKLVSLDRDYDAGLNRLVLRARRYDLEWLEIFVSDGKIVWHDESGNKMDYHTNRMLEEIFCEERMRRRMAKAEDAEDPVLLSAALVPPALPLRAEPPPEETDPIIRAFGTPGFSGRKRS
jgi:hypothetical protein